MNSCPSAASTLCQERFALQHDSSFSTGSAELLAFLQWLSWAKDPALI